MHPPLPVPFTYMTFRVARTLYAIPAALLDFVALPPLGGGTALRGEETPRIDLRERFGLPERERGGEEFLLVVSSDEAGLGRTALVVDQIEGLSPHPRVEGEEAELLDLEELAGAVAA